MAIVRNNPLLYEHLGAIIDAFEKEALNSPTRAGVMAVANAPLTGMDALARNSLAALKDVNRQRRSSAPDPHHPSTSTASGLHVDERIEGETAHASASANATFNAEASPQEGRAPGLDVDISAGVDVDLTPKNKNFDPDDPDLTWLQKTWGGGAYVEECLGCDARLQFDWQLKPLNLLGPIDGLLGSINGALDTFEARINPTRFASSLCDMGDALKGLCMPDITMMIMSLKFLLKQYLMQALNFRLDWTVILGPILKVIIQGVSSLIEALAGVLMAPLDCLQGHLAAVDKLMRESADLVNTAAEVAGNTAQFADQLTDASNYQVLAHDADATGSSLQFNDENRLEGDLFQVTGQNLEIPAEEARTTLAKKKNTNDSALPTGVAASIDSSKSKIPPLEDVIDSEAFLNSGLLGMVQPALQTARDFIQDLSDKIINALESLGSLVDGGLGLQLGNLGIVIFIMDMINAVMSMVKIAHVAGESDKDWCERLEDNPNLLVGSVFAGKTVDKVDLQLGEILLKNGPRTIGAVKTCGTVKSGPNGNLIKQWLGELEEKL